MWEGYRTEIAIGLVVLAIFILGAIFFSDVRPPDRIHSLRTWQEADAPPGYPVSASEEDGDGRIPEFRGDFVLLDGFERFLVPPASCLDWPQGTESGALTQVTQPFLADHPRRDLRHLGVDLAHIGSEGVEAAGAVRAVANGVVVYAGEGGEVPGKVVIAGHRLTGGRIVHSLYGRLQTLEVATGSLVARGQRIGTVEVREGSSAAAGLHFEFYDGPLMDPGSGYASGPLNRRDPAETISSYRPPSADDLAPEPLTAFEVEKQFFRIGPGGVPVPLEK